MEDDGDGVLSKFPEGILLHILSFLSYKSAVATSLLSRKWRRRWEKRWPYPSTLHHVDADGNPRAFVADVNRQFELHPPPRRLDVLSISFRPFTSHLPHLKRWLNYARQCGVPDLRLHLHSSPPKFVFSYESPSLLRLTLTGVHITRFRRFENLSSLEFLSLHQVTISEEALWNLMQSCQKLRSLELHRCQRLHAIFSLPNRGRGTTITTLRIVDCPFISCINFIFSSLRSLYLRDVPLSTMAFHFSRLKNVYMSWGWDTPTSDVSWANWCPAGAFAPVQFLTVGGVPFQHLALATPLALDNLQELQILMTEMTHAQFDIIYHFFTNVLCPNLERFFVELPPTSYGLNMGLLLGEEELPLLEGVSFEHLRIVKMKDFGGASTEMQLVKFFLKNATHLESMIIVAADAVTQESAHENYDRIGRIFLLFQQLELLPKASTTAKLSFYVSDDDRVQPKHHE